MPALQLLIAEERAHGACASVVADGRGVGQFFCRSYVGESCSEAVHPGVRPQEGRIHSPIQYGGAVPWPQEANSGENIDDEYEAFSREQPEALRRATSGREPTAAQKSEHEAENHAVFPDWCKICLAARAPSAVHRAVKTETLEEAR